MDGSAAVAIGGFLNQADDALDQCEAAEVLRGRVLTHYALYGEDLWLVELTRAGDWLGTALAELSDALPIVMDENIPKEPTLRERLAGRLLIKQAEESSPEAEL